MSVWLKVGLVGLFIILLQTIASFFFCLSFDSYSASYEIHTPVTYPRVQWVQNEAGLIDATASERSYLTQICADIVTRSSLVFNGPSYRQDDDTHLFVESPRRIELGIIENEEVIYAITLVAPSVTLTEERTHVIGGKLIGDLYVNAPHIRLEQLTIQGDVYYLTDEIEQLTEWDETSHVTGKLIVQSARID